MRWWSFKIVVLFLLLLGGIDFRVYGASPSLNGELEALSLEDRDVNDNKSPSIVSDGLIKSEQYKIELDARINRYKRGWNRLIPRYYKTQYAGSIGMISIGPGWDYGKKDQWETDFMVGFVSRFSSNRIGITLTLKQNYIPWDMAIYKNLSFRPLRVGIGVNTVLGNDFWDRGPKKYPSKYYKFSTRTRFHAFLGQEISFMTNIDISKRQISFYYELGTCDLYLLSAINNKYLKQ